MPRFHPMCPLCCLFWDNGPHLSWKPTTGGAGGATGGPSPPCDCSRYCPGGGQTVCWSTQHVTLEFHLPLRFPQKYDSHRTLTPTENTWHGCFGQRNMWTVKATNVPGVVTKYGGGDPKGPQTVMRDPCFLPPPAQPGTVPLWAWEVRTKKTVATAVVHTQKSVSFGTPAQVVPLWMRYHQLYLF